ncbi:MAG: hypothetical protein AVDCRST_MAG79-2472 [uncultured Thermoleophilia bacterium]|uniref:Uncharacterized protein n=1 Tax=uncultured Thermoleophilia bacterium TaxID=1497501 RepID=A0A6J4UF73_9ACTN|nr:MAG: hypothetical protein AVDCRST_MAG79-2472 [uncultured Thermoleophilia bacterium]
MDPEQERGDVPLEGFPPLPPDPHADEPSYDADEPVALSMRVAEGHAMPGVVELVVDPADDRPRWRVAAGDEEPEAALDVDARQATLGELVDVHPALEPLLLLDQPGRYTWDRGYQAFMTAEDHEDLDR